jgi:hypothetical protein
MTVPNIFGGIKEDSFFMKKVAGSKATGKDVVALYRFVADGRTAIAERVD